MIFCADFFLFIYEEARPLCSTIALKKVLTGKQWQEKKFDAA